MSNKTTIKLAENFSMPAVDYANQANAILGIRKAGKSFTAMKTAEELMDCGIPILAIDPIGIWKYLKIGQGKHKGYPIVVAGGSESDIVLTEHNCEEIVRAARKERISMVIDLHCRELATKALWIRIVHKIVDLLMYENQEHGLLHVYLEEAAEFIPQKLQPQHNKVYSALESMARMGRNVGLGLTVINQRAEEINKAILEICEFSFLHKQVGKNSMLSIQKWLEVRQVENFKGIIAELPKLLPGECFVVGEDHQPFKIKVFPKNTFHPDPKKGNAAPAGQPAMDVSGFVKKMKDLLEEKAPQKKEEKKLIQEKVESAQQSQKHAVETAALKVEIASKDQTILQLREHIKQQDFLFDQVQELVHKIEANHFSIAPLLADSMKTVTPVQGKRIPVTKSAHTVPKNAQIVQKIDTTVKQVVASNGKLGKCPLAILQFLATYPNRSFTKAQVGIATGYSPGSGGFNNALAELNTAGLIDRTDGTLQVKNVSNLKDFTGDIPERQYDIHTYSSKLSKCEREIYKVLLQFPESSFTKEALAECTESKYSPGSGGFNNALAALNTLELIRREHGSIKLNPELLELL